MRHSAAQMRQRQHLAKIYPKYLKAKKGLLDGACHIRLASFPGSPAKEGESLVHFITCVTSRVDTT